MQVESCSEDRLKDLWQEKGLFVSGSKVVLTDRIQGADTAVAEEAENAREEAGRENNRCDGIHLTLFVLE